MCYAPILGYSRKLFNVINTQNFFAEFYNAIKTEIEQMSDVEIVCWNF